MRLDDLFWRSPVLRAAWRPFALKTWRGYSQSGSVLWAGLARNAGDALECAQWDQEYHHLNKDPLPVSLRIVRVEEISPPGAPGSVAVFTSIVAVAVLILAALTWSAVSHHSDAVAGVLIVVAFVSLLAAAIQYSARGLGYLYVAHKARFVRSQRWRGVLRLLGVDEASLTSAQPRQVVARAVGDRLFTGVFKFALAYFLAWGVLIVLAALVAGWLGYSSPPGQPNPVTGAPLLVAAALAPAVAIYCWIRWRRESDTIVLVDVAATVFDNMCAGDSAAADWYRKHPERKADDCEAIQKEIVSLCANSENRELNKFRAKYAEAIDLWVQCKWYASLQADDRDIYARCTLDSTLAEQDKVYQDADMYWYMLASVLDAIIFHGSTLSTAAKEQLRRLQTGYADECRQNCELLMKIAKARNKGITLTDEEKARGKSTHLMREAFRRALAGEQVFDEPAATPSPLGTPSRVQASD